MHSSWQRAKDLGYIITAIVLVALLGRLFTRWKYARLDWDDLFNGLASMSLIGFTALPDLTDGMTSAYWAVSLTSKTLFWMTLWLVKAAFITLYWSIFRVSPSFRKAWMAITSYTCLSFFPVLLAPFWECGSPWNCVDAIACNAFEVSDTGTTYFWVVNTMSAVLHISTEVMILALPLFYIRRLQMSKTEKLNAGAIFSVAVITIIVGIIRNVISICDEEDICYYTVQITIILETPLAVLVCTLPPYKILLGRFRKRKVVREALHQQQKPSENQEAPFRRKPMRVVAIQDSITELEMP